MEAASAELSIISKLSCRLVAVGSSSAAKVLVDNALNALMC